MALNFRAFGTNNNNEDDSGLDFSAFGKTKKKPMSGESQREPTLGVASSFVPGATLGRPTGREKPIPYKTAQYKAGEPFVKVPFSNQILKPLLPTSEPNNALNDFLNHSVKYLYEFPEEMVNTVRDVFRGAPQNVPLNVPRVSTPISFASETYNKALKEGASDGKATFFAVSAGTFKFVADFAPLYPFAKLGAQKLISELPRRLLVRISSTDIPAQEIKEALFRSNRDGVYSPRATEFVSKLSNEDRIALRKVVAEAEKTSAPVRVSQELDATRLGEFAGVKPLNTSAFQRTAGDQQLPGYIRRPGQAPAVGLSTEELQPVGFGAKETKFYRGGGVGETIKGKTAQDIVNYETKELGNTLKIEKGVDLKTIPSENTKWFTSKAEDAKQYGEVTSETGNYKIIARDNFGGVLVDTRPAVSPSQDPRIPKTADGFVKAKGIDPDSIIIRDNKNSIVENSAGNDAFLTELPMETFGKPKFETLNQRKYEKGKKIIDPIEATLEDGKLRITDGANRFTQAIANGDKMIPTVIEVITKGKAITGQNVRSAIEAWLAQNNLSDLLPILRGTKGMTAKDIVKKYPNIKLTKDAPITDIYGNKRIIPEGEKLTPYELKGNKILLQDGETYIVSKNQFENIKGQSVGGKAKPFAPELKGTEESTKGGKIPTVGEIQKYADENKVTFREASERFAPGKDNTKFSQYQLPGGKNYKEILIKAPIEKPSGKSMKEYTDSLRTGTFKSSHWDEPNVISHLRLNERTYQGKKVTFMEEMQSDWAREVRTKGVQAREETLRFDAERKSLDAERAKIVAKYDNENNLIAARNEMLQKSTEKSLDDWTREREISTRLSELVAREERFQVPGNELLKNWQELSVKRVLQEAVNNKSDYLSWTNGEQQAARYNLSKQLEYVKWQKETSGLRKVTIREKSGGNPQSFFVDEKGIVKSSDISSFVDKPLDQAIGKGISEKILAEPKGNLSGEGLNIGGEWAKNLYDKQVKNIVEKVTGGKVEMIDMGLPVDKNTERWIRPARGGLPTSILKPEDLRTGKEIEKVNAGGALVDDKWIITDVLGEGKFKAIPKREAERADELGFGVRDEELDSFRKTFDISTKKSAGQQAIKLTPEIKVKIQGKSPRIKTSGKQFEEPIADLSSEAPKYKSAEEFVKAQAPSFRGGYGDKTPETYWLTSTEKNAIRFGRDAKSFATRGEQFIPDVTNITDEGINIERYGLKNGTKLFNTINEPLPKSILDKMGYSSYDGKSVLPGSSREIINNWAKKNGYDAVVYEHSGGNIHTAVFSKDSLLTKSQLTKIWEKANKGLGVTDSALRGIAKYAKEHGGITVSFEGEIIKEGYSFSVLDKADEARLPTDDRFDTLFIKKFAELRAKYNKDPKNHMGGWVTNGEFVVDIANVSKNLKESIYAGIIKKQDAIGDLAKYAIEQEGTIYITTGIVDSLEPLAGGSFEAGKSSFRNWEEVVKYYKEKAFKNSPEIDSEILSALNKGGIPGKTGLKKVGLAPEPSKKITTTEDVLLRKKIRDMARGAKIAYQNARISITNKLRNTLETKVGEIWRSAELNALRTNIKTRDFDRVKQEIVDYAKDNLSLSDRGGLLNMVANAKTQKNLAKAFLRIDKKVEESAIKEGISNLKKTIEKLTESNKIAIDYKNKIKELVSEYELKGHTAKTIEKLKATQDYLNKALEAGEDVDIPQRILDKLKILDRTPKNKLTLAQVETLQQEIELLGKLGETKLSSRQALYDAEKEARTNMLLETASPIKSSEATRTPVGEKPKARNKWIDKYVTAKNGIQKSRVGLMPMDGVAEITGMTPMKEALDISYGNYLSANDVRFKRLGEIINKHKLTDVEIKKVGVYAMAQQEGGIERLVENNGIPLGEIEKIKLNNREQELYDFIRSENEAVYPSIKKWAMDEYNVDVGRVDNYVSFQSSFDEMNDLAIYDRFGRRPEEEFIKTRTKNVEKGFVESRQKMSKNVLETDIVKVFMRHMDDAMYGINMGRDTKMYFEIVNSPAMREKLGDVGSLAWLQWLDLMARKGGIDGAKRIAALDILRKNISLGILGFRLSSALVQFTSIADTAATVGADWTARGAASIATSKEWRNFIMQNFPEIRKAVGDDVAFRDFDDVYFTKLAKAGMKPLQIMDGIMRSTAASGAYQKLAAEKGIAIDFANPNKELIQEATRFMRMSQGSSFFKDQPLSISAGYGLMDNRSLNKTLLTFQSFMLHRWDNIQRQVWRLGIKEKNYKKASTSFFWIVLVAAALEEGIRRGSRKAIDLLTGDETDAGSFEKNMALNMGQSVPVVGQIISSMEYGSNPVPVINAFDDAIEGLSSATKGSTIQTQLKGLLRAGGAFGSVAGVPGASQASQILRKAVPDAEKGRSGSSKLPGLPGIGASAGPKLPGTSRLKLPALPGL